MENVRVDAAFGCPGGTFHYIMLNFMIKSFTLYSCFRI